MTLMAIGTEYDEIALLRFEATTNSSSAVCFEGQVRGHNTISKLRQLHYMYKRVKYQHF